MYAHHITILKAAIAHGALHILKKGHSCSAPKAAVPRHSRKQDACVPGVRFMVSLGLKAITSAFQYTGKIRSGTSISA